MKFALQRRDSGATVPPMGFVRRRGEGWSWDGVAPRAYAGGAERHVLVGAADGATQVELRYFRIPAGGSSALERHPHEHAVLILHGSAQVQIGDEVHDAGPGDAVFVASDEVHQLRAGSAEPLGFLCTALVARLKGAPADSDSAR
jgi:quercetin dioxygenase-like cupin family protein